MTTLVLGGSGFIGRKLIRRLLMAGDHVVATSRQPVAQTATPNLTWRQVDLASFEHWDDLLNGMSLVYHLAWSTIPATAEVDPTTDTNVNVVGSIRLLDALKAHSNVRLVFVSSGGTVYGLPARIPLIETDPTNPIGTYGFSKLAVEHQISHNAAMNGLDAIVLRVGNPFGAGQLSRRVFGAVSTFCALAKMGKTLRIFGDGSIVRDYFHVDDAIDALLLAGTCRSELRTFNIGSGSGRSLHDVVRAIEGVLGRKVPVKYEAKRDFDVPVSILNITRARTVLGWQPRILFAEGIARTLAEITDDEQTP